MIEATMHALKHPAYAERYQRTKNDCGPPFDLRGNRGDSIRTGDRSAPAECAFRG